MKTLKTLIQDEQRRADVSDDMLRCFALNNFGKGDHAHADNTTLKYFKAHYIKACLLKVAQSDRVKPEVRERALKLAGV